MSETSQKYDILFKFYRSEYVKMDGPLMSRLITSGDFFFYDSKRFIYDSSYPVIKRFANKVVSIGE